MAILVGPLQDVCLGLPFPSHPRLQASCRMAMAIVTWAWPVVTNCQNFHDGCRMPLTSETSRPNQPRASPLGASGPPTAPPQLNVPATAFSEQGCGGDCLGSRVQLNGYWEN